MVDCFCLSHKNEKANVIAMHACTYSQACAAILDTGTQTDETLISHQNLPGSLIH